MTGQPIRSAISSKTALLVSLALAVSVSAGCGGGSSGGTGGTTGTGGASTGGNTGTGGRTGTGGASTGGNTGTGGASTGGSVGTGGTSTGGSIGTGGSTSTGGTTGTGGVGGKPATGGTTGTGGAAGAGGKSATGGTTGTGGAAGSSSAGSSGSCPAAMRSDFQSSPSGKGPADIGAAAVTAFKPHTGDAYSGAGYAWTFAYVASLQFTQLTNDTTNNAYLVSHFDCGQAGPDNSSSATVDTRAFGDLPLEIFVEKGTAACKTLGMARADAQWAGTADTSITPDARYWSRRHVHDHRASGFRLSRDPDREVSRPHRADHGGLPDGPAAIGRPLCGTPSRPWRNGAAPTVGCAAGMALCCMDLPSSNTNRATIMAGYKKMMDGLLPVQITSGTDAGAWRQVLDRTDAGAEMSCTAMFTYALVTGLKNGWISGAQYVTAAKNGWTALGNKTSSGQLSQVCPGTGQAYGSTGVGSDLKSQQDFYINLQKASRPAISTARRPSCGRRSLCCAPTARAPTQDRLRNPERVPNLPR